MTVAAAWPEPLFEHRTRPLTAFLIDPDGRSRRLDTSRWHAPASLADRKVLARVDGPVIDVGCGPGRLVAELVAAGVDALGVDCSATAVGETARRGAPVLHASVFAPLPRTGQWRTVLLLDGNVGIGGDPAALLARCAQLLAPKGRVLIETEAPHVAGHRGRFRVVTTDDVDADTTRVSPGPGVEFRPTSSSFPWATVSAGQIAGLGESSGFELTDIWTAGNRWFAELTAGQRAA